VTTCPVPGVPTIYRRQVHSQQSSWGARKLSATLPHAGCYFAKVTVHLRTSLFISYIRDDFQQNLVRRTLKSVLVNCTSSPE
jgi:hypothetical protein